jgi:uncharacterized protein
MRSLLEKWRYLYLAVIAGMTIFLGLSCLNLRVDRENRLMNADNESQSIIEEQFNKLFSEGDSVLVAVKRENILNEEGKTILRELNAGFREIKGVENVESLEDTGFSLRPYQENLQISADRTTASIRLLLNVDSADDTAMERTLDAIRQVGAEAKSDLTEVALSGLPLQKFESGRLVLRDQRIFSLLSFIVLGIVLLCITRAPSGMIFPLIVSAISIGWTLGIYTLCGFQLNMITSLLPPVIMTLSVATTIHVYQEWRNSSVTDPRERILQAVRTVYRPCLFASVTTMIGFLSLYISYIPAVRLFGVFAAIGVGISFLTGVSGLAVGLSFLKPPPPREKGPGGSRRIQITSALSNFTIRHPRMILAISLLLASLTFFGVRQVKSNTNLLDFLGKNSELARDTEFIGKNLTGPNSIELLISRSDGGALATVEDLREISSLESSLLKIPHLRHVLSAADFLPEELPGTVPLSAVRDQIDLSKFLSDDFRFLRMTLRCEAIGTDEGEVVIAKVKDTIDGESDAKFTVQVIGEFYRVIIESNQLTSSQIKSFGIALALILCSIGIVFRSIRYMLIAVIPNVVPLLFTAAVMGFADIPLSAGTMMIASVVLGIAVDDTIHYLSAFRRTYRSSADEAIRHTTAETGFTLIATTIALSLGFLVAIFGSFQPTVYFGLLSGLTMWFALACDLIVLPACLKLSFR